MAGNDKFRGDIKRFITKSNAVLDKYAKAVVLNLDKSMVMKSPVDTGRFRANWNIGIGSVDSNTSDATDISGSGAISKAVAELNSFKVNGQIIYITNSLPYAYRLEYEGWSSQSPQGMVRITLAELSGILRQAAYEVKK
jgi:hypothetical protein